MSRPYATCSIQSVSMLNGLAVWRADMSRIFHSIWSTAWRGLACVCVDMIRIVRSICSKAWRSSNQIMILSDSSFWAYDENYQRHSYQMPLKNMAHYAKGGADLLDDGIQRVLNHHSISLCDITNSRVIFLHMPSTLHQDLNNIRETDYWEWKYNMKQAAHIHYTWAKKKWRNVRDQSTDRSQ